jgi:hypothetical protein
MPEPTGGGRREFLTAALLPLLRGGWGAGGLVRGQSQTPGPSAAAGAHGGGDHAGGPDRLMVMEQERLIPTAESLTVEFKSDHKAPLGDKDLVLAAVCLANNQGGDLYLGVEDDGTVTGLHSSRDRNRELAAVIASRTNLPLPVSAIHLEESGKGLIWFQVPPVQGTVFSSDGKALVRALDVG